MVKHPPEQKPSVPRSTPAQRKNDAVSTVRDQRPQALVQRQLAAAINASPRQIAQKAQLDVINNPARVVQQQARSANGGALQLQEAGPAPNRTGLPDQLKSGVESLSGMSLDHVKVHYNSAKPAQLNAHAYAQGSEIHVGPGQQQHLPHEAWHVVQQAQGRVAPTMQMAGVAVNDDDGLEREADVMGEQALAQRAVKNEASSQGDHPFMATTTVQKKDNTTQRTSAPAPATVQRKITVNGEKYGMQDGNLDELKERLNINVAFAEERLKNDGISIDQVLTRFDFQNRKFDHIKTLIEAIRIELKKDFGEDQPSIDKLVPIHPLATDDAPTLSPVLDLLKEKDPTGNVRNLILEDTDAAREVMDIYRRNTMHPVSDTVLFKSILATIELHKSGSISREHFSDKENEVLQYATHAYDPHTIEEMVADYGLNKYEHNAVIAYSLPNKDKLFVGGAWNPQYMGFSRGNWGPYGDGWTALAAAMHKLPNLGKLRLNPTTYRSSRNSEESEHFEKMAGGTHILHGKHVLGQEQQHYTSTALTYNVHLTPDRVQKAKGLMAIHGTSGVLINPFGGQGFLDGAEILFPPNMVTRLSNVKGNVFSSPTFTAPVYHLHEVPPTSASAPLIDDFKFKQLQAAYAEQQARNTEKITALIYQIEQFSKVITGGQKAKLTMGDQSVEKLTQIKQQLLDTIEQNQGNQEFVENYEKLILIDKLNAMPFEKKNELEIRLSGKPVWQESLAQIQEYASHFGVF